VPLLSLLALVGGALCFAEAAVLVRRFPQMHPVTMNAVGMTTGAALLVIGSVLAGEPIALPQLAATWVAVGYLVAIGSVRALPGRAAALGGVAWSPTCSWSSRS
jgi:drug/metabolite transporter (DMT)-like permease